MATVVHTTTSDMREGPARCKQPSTVTQETIFAACSTSDLPRVTRFSAAFTDFLPILARFVEDERDLEDISFSYDSAYSDWFRDAAIARDRLEKAIGALHALPVHLPEDRPLHRIVTLVADMLEATDPARPRRLHRDMKAVFFQQFQVRGFGPTARDRNALLIQARHLIDAMAKLPLFDFSSEEQIDFPDTCDMSLGSI